MSTEQNGEDVNTTGVCPAALGTKDQQPAAFSPETGLFYVPTNHVCMDYEPFRVSYTAGQPYVGATLSCIRAEEPWRHGQLHRLGRATGEIEWSSPSSSGVVGRAGDCGRHGVLRDAEGYLKAVDAETGKELYRFKTPSGIIGNVTTYEHDGKQYIAVLSGVGGWAGIGLAGFTDPENAAAWQGAAGRELTGRALESEERNIDTAGLGAVGGYAGFSKYTALGGQLTVFALPHNSAARARTKDLAGLLVFRPFPSPVRSFPVRLATGPNVTMTAPESREELR